MAGAASSGFVLGVFAFLLGIAAIAAAIRRRRGPERYPETYAASGGIIYTAVSMGCGVGLLVAGRGPMGPAPIFKPQPSPSPPAGEGGPARERPDRAGASTPTPSP